MIVGIGVDVVDVGRFSRALERTPRLLERVFAPGERPHSAASLAARFAAKEALVKALGGPTGLAWQEVVVRRDVEGRPSFALEGRSAERVATLGIDVLHLSMSHDAGVASAFVIAERVAQ